MDADLQDPPEVVEQMIAKWKEGYDVVYARRLSRAGESRFKRATAHLFYRMLGSMSSVDIPPDVGDFRLIDRKVLDALAPDAGAGPLRARHDRLARLSADRSDVPSPPRLAGETKYPFCKMLELAINGALGFSDAPLRLAIWCGLAVSALALLYGSWVLVSWMATTIWSPAGPRPSSSCRCCAA